MQGRELKDMMPGHPAAVPALRPRVRRRAATVHSVNKSTLNTANSMRDINPTALFQRAARRGEQLAPRAARHEARFSRASPACSQVTAPACSPAGGPFLACKPRVQPGHGSRVQPGRRPGSRVQPCLTERNLLVLTTESACPSGSAF